MTAELFHAGLGWPIALTLIAASFLGSFITVAFGIGGGQVMLAVFATLLPAAAIIPVHGLVQLGSNAGRTALTYRHLKTGVASLFAVGALIGVGLGTLFFVQLNPAAIQIGVGLFILWSILFKPPAFMRRSAGIAGAISSFLTMFFGATGPFVAAFVTSLRLGKMSHTATHATLMTIQHTLKTVAFGFLGFAFSLWAGLIGLLIASGFLGTIVGRRVLVRVDEHRFRLILNVILTLLAARLIYAGTADFLIT
ncbi:sulfite exporter TauE/SafE family protein [Tropicimonas sp. S265A]|uniref:sulfite exporter TauE/SafE family protein n=1 Tax=Tropicimonas sp. S265A TaxID=3415134 RepID=UPI003C7E2A56